mgnify:CR=1 FL=1
MRKSQLLKTSGFTALAVACVASSAWAQPAADDQIIVTATRRAASVQDVPINIAAVGGDQIAELDVNPLIAGPESPV